MRTKVREIAGAAAWASAIVNGDRSGLDAAECAELDNWLKLELEPGDAIVSCDGESYFSNSYALHTHSARFTAGDLLDYQVLTSALWFSTSSGRIELNLYWDEATSGHHQGQCDDDVEGLSKQPEIASQLAAIDAKLLAAELKEYGAWDEDELADHEQNLQRLLWLACGDITDNPENCK